MAIEYSGWVEVPKGESFGGGIVRIPFTFEADQILEYQERIDRLQELFNQWRSILMDYDASREGQYGEPTSHRFTSVVDLGIGPATREPHFGK